MKHEGKFFAWKSTFSLLHRSSCFSLLFLLSTRPHAGDRQSLVHDFSWPVILGKGLGCPNGGFFLRGSDPHFCISEYVVIDVSFLSVQKSVSSPSVCRAPFSVYSPTPRHLPLPFLVRSPRLFFVLLFLSHRKQRTNRGPGFQHGARSARKSPLFRLHVREAVYVKYLATTRRTVANRISILRVELPLPMPHCESVYTAQCVCIKESDILLKKSFTNSADSSPHLRRTVCCTQSRYSLKEQQTDLTKTDDFVRFLCTSKLLVFS